MDSGPERILVRAHEITVSTQINLRRSLEKDVSNAQFVRGGTGCAQHPPLTKGGFGGVLSLRLPAPAQTNREVLYLHTTHGVPGDRVTIAANHFIGLGLDVPNPILPWLVADRQLTSYPIVIHRSARYRGPVDYSFLREITEEWYCVGSEDERRPFEAIGARPIVTKDVRALAAVINSCDVFIGNQSLPLALAVGLGKRRMVEVNHRLPNVVFGGADEFIMTSEAGDNHAGLRKLREGAVTRSHLFHPEEVTVAD